MDSSESLYIKLDLADDLGVAVSTVPLTGCIRDCLGRTQVV